MLQPKKRTEYVQNAGFWAPDLMFFLHTRKRPSGWEWSIQLQLQETEVEMQKGHILSAKNNFFSYFFPIFYLSYKLTLFMESLCLCQSIKLIKTTDLDKTF